MKKYLIILFLLFAVIAVRLMFVEFYPERKSTKTLIFEDIQKNVFVKLYDDIRGWDIRKSEKLAGHLCVNEDWEIWVAKIKLFHIIYAVKKDSNELLLLYRNDDSKYENFNKVIDSDLFRKNVKDLDAAKQFIEIIWLVTEAYISRVDSISSLLSATWLNDEAHEKMLKAKYSKLDMNTKYSVSELTYDCVYFEVSVSDKGLIKRHLSIDKNTGQISVRDEIIDATIHFNHNLFSIGHSGSF